jgi:hypothetical protein
MNCNHLRKFVLSSSMLAALVCCRIEATAATTAVTVDVAGTMVGIPFSLGYRFDVAQPISVTDLGKFDVDGGGIADGTLVRLYDWTSGAEIATATLGSTSTMETTGSYNSYFESITPVTLNPGTYLLATESAAGDFVYTLGSLTSVTFAPGVTWVEGRATPVGSPAMPATADATTFLIARSEDSSYFGPNFKFDAVPEPGTFVLTTMGGLVTILMMLPRCSRRWPRHPKE